MAALKLMVIAATCALASPANADPVTRWRAYTHEASARFGVPLAWIERVMTAESGGQTELHGRAITSPAGAMGLMQVMPDTWAEIRAQLSLGFNPHDPHDNILAGAYYLSQMYRRFGYPGLFAAYNAGPGRYAAFLGGRRGLPGETRAYIASVAGTPGQGRPAAAAAPPRQTLFAVRYAGATAAEASQPPPENGLFVRLSGE